MKPFAVNLISSVLAFACGFATASSKVNRTVRMESRAAEVVERHPPPPPKYSVNTSIDAGHEAIQFGDGLTIVNNEVNLKSERLRYDIDVRYPQIVGTEDAQIANLNWRIKDLTTREYERPLNPTPAELHNLQLQPPNSFNVVNMDYQVGTATNSFLSLYFDVNTYNINSANWVQYGLTLNYDLKSKKELKLWDIFKPGSKYLEFISDYCQVLISRGVEAVFHGGLTPQPKNFENWQITPNGIRFRFDECKVLRCAAGVQNV